ncbi:hypothetical protein PWT90_03964 [Aphanocladium album]|nr:hypothetical protein PWT90_03964 [Aphanocladium album]
MNVFVRWRPLVGQETSEGSVEHGTVAAPAPSSLLAVTVNRRLAPSDKPWKSAAAFDAVLDGSDSNDAAYSAIVQPTVLQVMRGGCCSFFAYGHSGSGKTHTVVGYETDKSGLGLCLAAAKQLFEQIATLNGRENKDGDEKHPPLAIGLSVFELRQKAAFDLLNNSTKCHIREGSDGKVHIRGETETLSEGKVRVQPIVKRPCWTFDELQDTLRAALARRAVGTSSIHNQSSRTHAVLELEIINEPLVAARAAVIDRQSELVPVGKHALDVTIAEQTKGVLKDADGNYKPRPGYTVNQALIDEVTAEKDKFEARVAEAEAEVDALYAKYNNAESTCLGGKMVFVDLAGAEYQQDSSSKTPTKMSTTAQTPAERQEARQINSDLLALKEVMRAWSTRQKRVPYRSSPLTMVLRETFADARNCGSGMVVTVSPAKTHHAATLNSLKYGSLMGTAR